MARSPPALRKLSAERANILTGWTGSHPIWNDHQAASKTAVPPFDLKFLSEIAGPNDRNLKFTALGVTGFGRKHAEIDSDLLERAGVFATGIGAEDQFRIRRAMQPAIMLDFILQLARRPARIAERKDCATRSRAARNRLEDVESSR